MIKKRCIEMCKTFLRALILRQVFHIPTHPTKTMHELKLIVDLMYEGGIANMNYSISNNAEYGEYVTGQKVIGEESRTAMRECLKNIQNGDYAKRFILEGRTNYPEMTARRRLNAEHPIEKVGAQLRGMMPWISKNKLVDQSKN